jgi:hypothetical protein
MYGAPLDWPTWKIETMLGWFRVAVACALPFETLKAIRIPRPVVREHLDRHVAFQQGVARAIHFAHSARAQGRNNLVGIQTGTCGQ